MLHARSKWQSFKSNQYTICWRKLARAYHIYYSHASTAQVDNVGIYEIGFDAFVVFECCLRVRLNPVSVFIALDKYMHTYDTFIVWRFHFWKSTTISIFQSWKRKSHSDSILIVWKSFHFVLFKSGRFGRKVKDPSCSLYKCILIRQILLWVYTGASKFGWRCIRTTPIA